MPLGWAIAGIGSHADLKIGPAMKLARDSRLVAVYSRDQSRADAPIWRHPKLELCKRKLTVCGGNRAERK